MNKINLLPDSVRIKPSTVRTAELFKKLYIIIFVILFITIATSVGLFYMYHVRLNEADDRQATIKRQIKALEETEQRLILVKDRLSKVEQISKTKNAEKELEGFNYLIDNKGVPVSMEQMNADNQELNIKFKSNSSVDILDFLNLVKDSEEFKVLTVQSMQFTPKGGFETEILFQKK